MSLCSHFVVVLRASFVEMDVGRLGRLARPPCALYFRSFVDGGHAFAFSFTPPFNAPHSILSVLVVCVAVDQYLLERVNSVFLLLNCTAINISDQF